MEFLNKYEISFQIFQRKRKKGEIRGNNAIYIQFRPFYVYAKEEFG